MKSSLLTKHVRSSLLLTLFALFSYTTLLAQDGVLIDYQATPPARSASAVLELRSNNQGFLAPKVNIANLTTAAPVTSPAEGLVVYNTNTTTGKGYYYWDGTRWMRLLNGASTPPTGSGTLNYITKWTPNGTTLGNSQLFDNGTGVGIGTTSISNAKLQIEGNTTYDAIVRINNTGTDGARFFMGSTMTGWDIGSNMFIMGHGSPSSLNTDVAIDSDGKVGIGVSPSHKLDVSGVVNAATGYRQGGGAATTGNYLRGNGSEFVSSAIQTSDLPTIVTAGGWTDDGAVVRLTTTADNVGIGTTAPKGKLEVIGDIWATLASSNDHALRIRPGMTTGNQYGFADQHSSAMAFVNEQGTTNQAFVLGDVDATGTNTLFGVSVSAGIGNPSTGAEAGWSKRFEIAGNGTVRLNTYTTNGIVRATAGDGTLSSTGGNINLTSEVTGILPVGNGGSGTGTAFTPGSVIFAGTGGVYAQDNPNLFWDNANDRLGIGIATPSSALEIYGNASNIEISNTHETDAGIIFNDAQATTNQVFQIMFNSSDEDLHFRSDQLTDIMTLENDGNVGIGIADPVQKLDVQGNIMHTGTMMSRGANYNSTWMRYDEDVYGNSLILGGGGLTVVGAGESHTAASAGIANPGLEDLYLTSDQGIELKTGLQSGWAGRVDAMSIKNTGEVGIGTTSPAHQLHVAGLSSGGGILIGQYNERFGWTGSSSNIPFMALRFAGYRDVVSNFTGAMIAGERTNINTSGRNQGTELGFWVQPNTATVSGDGNLVQRAVVYGAGIAALDYYYLSDKRIKSNLAPIKYGLNEVMQLSPSSYTQDVTKGFRESQGSTGETEESFGFIAQDIEKIIPEIVNTPDDPDKYWTVSYGKLTPIIVKAMQEQQAIIEEGVQERADLQRQIDELKRIVQELHGK